MAANDTFPRGTFQSLSAIGSAVNIVLPASPAVLWRLTLADLFVWAAAPANQFYDGNLIVYDGPTSAAPIIGTILWQFFVSAAGNTGFSDEVTLDDPITGSAGNAMLISSVLANGVLANTQQRLKVSAIPL